MTFFQNEIVYDSFYNIGVLRLQFFKLQKNDNKVKALGFFATGFLKSWENNKRVFQYQNLSYIPEIIRSQLISCHYNDLFAKYFEIAKIQKLIARILLANFPL